MNKLLTASIAVVGMALAGPALANCNEDLAAAEAEVQASTHLTEAERAEATAMLAEAEVAMQAGDDARCLELAADVRTIAGEEGVPSQN